MTEPRGEALFHVELRVPNMDKRIIEGIIVPWNEVSYLTPDPKGERFLPGSLDRTIEDRGHLVKLFRIHDQSKAYARPIRWDSHHADGLFGEFQVGRGAACDAFLDEVADGLLDAFSLGFQAKKEQRGADGVREVVEARMYEASLAPIGAYDGARVTALRAPSLPARIEVPEMPTVNLEPLPTLTRGLSF